MSTKQHSHTHASRDGLFGCVLLLALLISSVLVLFLGSFATSGRKNPIENLMLAIRDGFETEAKDIEDDVEDEWGDDWEDDGEDKWGDDWDAETTEAPETDTDETTESEITKAPQTITDGTAEPSPDDTVPVTTESESNPTTDIDTSVPDKPSSTAPTTEPAPETTVLPTTKPAVTEPPTTNPPATEPPVTKPPVTKPPVTEPPVVDPDRVNDPDYYSDALFIGDSRTVGLATYGKISGATYFARTSMNVANAFADKKSETEKSGLNLTDFLTKYKFKKIYILLGINEIGYSYSWIMTRYEKVVNKIRELQPDAIIVIQSNMHVTQKKSDASPNTFNNDRINGLNKRLASLADNKTVFYADMAYIFDNENGAMKPEYTGDGVHLKGKYYALWRDWLLEKGKR